MTEEEKKLVRKMCLLIEEDAADKAYSAGMDGAREDYGAGALRDQVKFFRYGMNGVIPTEWTKYEVKAKDSMDPEYSEYQRLKEKFGD